MSHGELSGVSPTSDMCGVSMCQGLMWPLLRYPFVIRRQFALPLPFVTALKPGVLVGRGVTLGF